MISIFKKLVVTSSSKSNVRFYDDSIMHRRLHLANHVVSKNTIIGGYLHVLYYKIMFGIIEFFLTRIFWTGAYGIGRWKCIGASEKARNVLLKLIPMWTKLREALHAYSWSLGYSSKSLDHVPKISSLRKSHVQPLSSTLRLTFLSLSLEFQE